MIFIDFNGEIPNQPPGTKKTWSYNFKIYIIYIRLSMFSRKCMNKCFLQIRGIGEMYLYVYKY